MKKLRISENKRYLMYEDGEPFFFLGDTAWELFHRLSREEIDYYLETRKSQGFNVIQAVALAEFEGLTKNNIYGRFPLKYKDNSPCPELPDTDGENHYWTTVDHAVNKAESLDMFVGLLPTWGDKINMKWGVGPEIFNPENAYIYGKWIADRYKDNTNIIWILGGDRPLETENHVKIIDEMARGIKETVGDKHLITFHPCGCRSSVEDLKNKDYIDFHTVQSSHGIDGYESYKLLQKTREAELKPFMDSEPRYEDHPSCFTEKTGYLWDAADVRSNLYWNIFEGACGNTYGNHNIWSFNRKEEKYFPFKWLDVLRHEGAETIQYAVKLRMSRDYFSLAAAPELVVDDGGITAHIAAARGSGYAFAYSPFGLPFTFNFHEMKASILKLYWFNPRSGEFTCSMVLPGKSSGKLVPPTSGKGQDWIAVIDVFQ